MLKKIWNHFNKTVIHDQRGVDPFITGSLITAGAGLLGGWLSGQEQDKAREDQQQQYEQQLAMMQTPPTFMAEPRYPEATGAREGMYSKLQEWGGQPGYGAIQPDWGDIWKTAQSKVNQYYWGGPGGQPGLASKVKASAARRGVSESPALETGLGQMGMQEAGQLGEMATAQGIEKARLSEAGRKSWMGGMERMMNLRTPGSWWSPGMPAQPNIMPSGAGQAVAGLGGAAGSALMSYGQQQDQQSWLESMFNKTPGGSSGTMPGSVTGGGYGLQTSDFPIAELPTMGSYGL